MLFSHENVGSSQWTLHSAEGFLPTTIKSHVVKIVIMWSLRPDENINIGLVINMGNILHKYEWNRSLDNKFMTLYLTVCPRERRTSKHFQ